MIDFMVNKGSDVIDILPWRFLSKAFQLAVFHGEAVLGLVIVLLPDDAFVAPGAHV